jgi:hypothetical protein
VDGARWTAPLALPPGMRCRAGGGVDRLGGKRSLTGTSRLFSRTFALPGEFEQPVAQRWAFFGLSHLPVAGCQRGVLCYSLMGGPSNGIAYK